MCFALTNSYWGRFALYCLILTHSLGGIASAQEVFREDTDWRVTYLSDGSYCLAEQKTGQSGGLVIGKSADAVEISILDPKLSWVEDKKAYDATILIDGTRWTGAIQATKLSDAGTISVSNPIPRFIEAVQRGSRLSLVVENAAYGPYRLSGTRKVFADLADCVASSVRRGHQMPDSSSRAAKYIPTNSMLEWGEGDLSSAFSGAGFSVQIVKALTDDATLRFIISKEGSAPITIDSESAATPSGAMGLYPIGDETPKLLITNYTGGAHCCTLVRIVDLSKPRPTVLNVGGLDGDSYSPDDIDGDGVFELPIPDDRFLYTFGGYADSSPPTTVLTILDGALNDVTRDLRYTRLHEKNFSQQSEACGYEGERRPPACAGLAATASILGILPETLANIEISEIDSPGETSKKEYNICDDNECRRSEKFVSFEAALIHALKRWGYTTASPSKKFTETMATLLGRSFGDVNPNSELSCGSGPTRFSRERGPLDTDLIHISGYESGCWASTGAVFGTSVYMRTVCQGEGSPPWIEHKLFNIGPSRLSIARLGSGLFISEDGDDYIECPRTHDEP